MMLTIGAKVTLIISFILHILVFKSTWIAYATEGPIPIIWSTYIGLAYIFYPLCGWVADIWVSHHSIIKCSLVLALISSVCLFIVEIICVVQPNLFENELVAGGLLAVFVACGIAGLGMFEANAIQFGLDQMLEASSEQLSSFIHWYFWCNNIGPLLIYYVVVGIVAYNAFCVIHADNVDHSLIHLMGLGISIPCGIQIIAYSIGIAILYQSRRHIYTDRVVKNPLKIVLRILEYSYKHSYPEQRSAFTYWENDTPSRINLGKQKYGGPFTNEQVEDFKTFCRLLLMIVLLCGFHLSGDGYSLTYFAIKSWGCPPIASFVTVVANPRHISLIAICIVIPAYKVLLRSHLHRYLPNMLGRIKFGMFVCLVNEGILLLFTTLHKDNDPFECSETEQYEPNPPPLLRCIAAITTISNESTCSPLCSQAPKANSKFYLLAVPSMLNGIAYFLVFVTTVEFLCAQAPNATKGLLIGIWYSTLSIKYVIVNFFDTSLFFTEVVHWSIYHFAKGLGIFLSICCFTVFCKYYSYRERDEIVNEYTMIAEQYERELLMNRNGISSKSSVNA